MNKLTISFYLLVIMLTTWACSSPIRITEREASPEFRLANYSSFGFYDELEGNNPAPAEYAPYINILKREITQQLQAKGLKYAQDNPEMLINLGLSVADKTQTRTTRFGQDGPYYSGQRRYTWKSQEVPVGRYQEGTVAVDLVDRAKNELVWKAEAVSIIPKKEETIEKRIAEGVQKLFEDL